MDPETIRKVILRLSNLPLMSSLSILQYWSDYPYTIPFGPFYNLQSIVIGGYAPIDDLPTVIAHSPHLVKLCIQYFPHLDANNDPSILSLFSAFPHGQFSNLQVLNLSGLEMVLHPSSVPSLIPHLRQLTDLSTSHGFVLPAVFWDCLRDAKIHLESLLIEPWDVDPALLRYLSSFTGMRQLDVVPISVVVRNEYSERPSNWFLRVTEVHAHHLTKLHISPFLPGAREWCLNELMIGHLLLCIHLESISVRVDDNSTRVKGSRNVVVSIPCL